MWLDWTGELNRRRASYIRNYHELFRLHQWKSFCNIIFQSLSDMAHGEVTHKIFWPALPYTLFIKVVQWNRKTFLFSFCFLLRSADNVGRPFCCCIVFSLLLRSARLRRQTFMFLFCLLCIIIIKVSDFSRKPFCFRSVFSSLLFFFTIFLLSLPLGPFCYNFVNSWPIYVKFSQYHDSH